MKAKFLVRNITALAGLAALLAAPAMAAPVLTPGVWTNITPPSVTMTPTNNVFCQGMAIDPENPSTIYLGVCAYDVSLGGLYKTTDGGSNWAKVGQLDEPVHIVVDPHNSNHLYCVDGVRGNTEGFWVSNDGGNTWTMPQGFVTESNVVGNRDLYSVAVDPTNFNHVLVSYHSPWNNTSNAGVLESNNGGSSWIAHQPPAGSAGGYGMDVFFLDNPATGQGNSNTWLFTAQQGGFFRTTDGGNTWSLAYNKQMTHGGDQLYRTASGVLYAGGYQYPVRSTDNGASWQQVTNGLVYSWYMGICGDGTNLFTSCSNDNEPFFVSPESNGSTWTAYNGGAQTFTGEAFEMDYDATNHIMYSASWGAGLLALNDAAAPTGATWNVTGGGSWLTASNWTNAGGTYPNGTTATATFGASNPTTASAVTLDAAITLNSLTLSNANQVTISAGSGGSLTFDGTTPSVSVTAGSHIISAPVSLNASTTFTISSGAQLALGGGVSNGIYGSQGLALSNSSGSSGTLALTATNSYTGATSVAGGILSLQAAGAINQSAITVSGGQLTQTAANAISNTASLTVTGGTATLSRANNYSGGTTVSGTGVLLATNASGSANGKQPVAVNAGGTLGGSGSIGGLVTVASGGIIAPQPGTGASYSTLTVGSLSVASGGILDFNLGPSGASDKVSVSNNLTLAGSETINVTFPAGLQTGTYQLIGEGIGTTTDTSTITVSGTGAESYTLLKPGAPGNSSPWYEVQVSINTNAATWAVGNGTWDINTSPNWSVVGGGNEYFEGMPVVFDDTASGASPIAVSVIAAGVNPSSVTFNNNNKNYTLSNASGTVGITGSTGVTMTGTGTVTFNSQNTYTGATDVNAGTLIVNAPLTATSAVSIGLGGTLQIGNNSNTGSIPAALTVSDSGTLALSRTDGTRATTLAFNNNISGTGGITYTGGTGWLQLGGTSSYQGPTVIDSGTLVFSAANNLGNTSGIYLGATSGTANAALYMQWRNTVSFSAPLTVQAGSSGTATVGTMGAGNNLTFAGPVTLYKTLTVNADQEQGGSQVYFTNATLTGVGGIIKLGQNNAGQNYGYYQYMFYTPATSPTFQGGTISEGGGIQWQRSAATTAGGDSLSFGTGDITLDGTAYVNYTEQGNAPPNFNSYVAPGDFELYDTQSGTVNNAPVTLTNNIDVIGQGGGGLYGWQSNGANKPNVIFSGNINLAGALTVGNRVTDINNNTLGGGSPIQYTGTVAINQASAGVRSIQYTVQSGSSMTAAMTGSIVDGTGSAAGIYDNPLVIRAGNANFTIQGTANTYAGGTIIESNDVLKYLNGGAIGNSSLVTVNANSSLGAGGAIVAPNAALQLKATSNLAAGQTVFVDGDGPALGVLSLCQDTSTVASMVDGKSSGVLALDSTTFANNLNMASIGNGSMYLGAVGAATTFSGTLGAGNGNTYNLGGGGTLTISSPLGDASGTNLVVGAGAGVRYNGTGTVVLSNANTYAGSTTVNQGSTLQGVAQASGSPFGSTTAVNLNDGNLTLAYGGGGTTTSIPAVTVTGYGKIGVTGGAGGTTLLNAASVNVNPASPGSNVLLIDSSVNGTTAQFTVTGMAAATVLPGCFISTNNTGANNANGNFVTYSASAGFAPYSAYTVGNATWSNVGAGSGSMVVSNTAAATLASGTNPTVYGLKLSTTTAALNLNGNTLNVGPGGIIYDYDDGNTAGGPQITGNVAFGSNPGYIYTGVISAGNAAQYGDRNPNISGTITGSAGLTITGPGTFTQAAANQFSGITGTITVNGSTLNLYANSGTTTDTSNYAFNNATLQPYAVGGLNPVTMSGQLTLNQGGVVVQPLMNGTNENVIALSGKITGVGSLTLNPGYQVVQVTGTAGNNYSGGTVIGPAMGQNQYGIGYVQVASGSSLGSGDLSIVGPSVVFLQGTSNLASTAAVNMVSNSTLYMQAAGTWTIGSLQGGGQLVLGPTSGSAATNLVVGDSSNRTFYGNIVTDTSATFMNGGTYSGVLSLTKQGTGTLSLLGSNTYTGGTSVTAGTLVVGALPNSSVFVSPSAALGGAGSIGGNVSVNGGTLFGGRSASAPGTLDIGGTLGITGTTVLSGGTVAVAGATTISGGASLTVSGTLNNAATVSVSGTGIGVLAGVLAGSGSISGPVSVGSYGQIGPSANLIAVSSPVSAASSMYVSSLTLNSGSYLDAYTGPAGTSDTIYVAAAGSLTNTGTVSVDLANPSQAGTFDLIHYSGTSNTLNPAQFSVSDTAIGTTDTFAWNVVSDCLTLNVTSSTFQTWNGGSTGPGDNNWTTGANWGGTAPTSGNAITFDGTNRTTSNNNTGFSVSGLFFNPTAAAFTLTGNAITLTGNILSNSPNLQTINLNLALNPATAPTTITNTAGNMVIGGVISDNGGGVTIAGSGHSVALSNLNTYTGPTTISSGAILIANSLSAAGGTPSSVGAAAFSATSLIIDGGTLRYTGGALTTSLEFTMTAAGATLDASGTTGTALVFNNGHAFNAAGPTAATLTLTGTNTSLNTFLGTISDYSTPGAPTTLTKSGTGTWLVSTESHNDFTGPVNLNGGVLVFDGIDALGLGTAINFNGGTLQWATAAQSPYGPATDDISVRTVTINGGGATLDLQSNNVTSSNPIGNGGSGSLTKLGSGMLALDAAATYAGGTNINQGTLQIGVANALPASGAVSLGAATTNGTLDLNGQSQTVGGLATGAGAAAANQTIGNSSTSSNATLTFMGGAGTSMFNGAIVDALPAGGTKKTALAVTSGTLNLGGANTFSGGVTVNGGTLNANSSSALGAASTTLTVSSGGLNVNSAGVTVANANLTSGTVNASTHSLTFTNQLTTASNIFTASGGPGVQVSGTSIGNDSISRLMTLNGGTLTAVGGTSYTSFASGWQFNGSASQSGNVLTLTTDGGGQAGTAWYTTPFTPGRNYTLSFTYSETSAGQPADGFTVGFQNVATSPTTALGGNGSGLGFTGITPSLAWGGDIFNGNGASGEVASQLWANGAAKNGETVPGGSPSAITGRGTYNVSMQYTAATDALAVTLTQNGNTWTQNFSNVNYGTALGSQMYFGFTGGTGGQSALQQISNLDFTYGSALNVPNINLAVTSTSTFSTSGAATVGNVSLTNASTLTLAGATSMTFGNVTLTAGTTLNMATNNIPVTAAALADANPASTAGETVSLGSATLTVGSGNTSTTFSGHITGTGGSLVKVGSSTLTLAGTGNYTGGTSVEDGLLIIDSSEAIPSGSTVAVGPGAAVVLGDPSLPSDGTSVSGLSPGSGLGSGGGLAASANVGVPEPGTLALLAAGAIGLLACVWRRAK